jgi:hypothetical protein
MLTSSGGFHDFHDRSDSRGDGREGSGLPGACLVRLGSLQAAGGPLAIEMTAPAGAGTPARSAALAAFVLLIEDGRV